VVCERSAVARSPSASQFGACVVFAPRPVPGQKPAASNPPPSVQGGRSRERDAEPVYVDLILWDVQAAFAVKHLVKGQAVAFSGRLHPRTWEGRDGEQRVALEVHGVDLEYRAKPRNGDPAGEPVDEVPA
jgi:single-stranded DNA-binding protein